MKNGDVVQIRQFDGSDHWIRAKVIDAANLIVHVDHKGNVDHGKTMPVAAADIRTKADVQALITACTPIVNAAHPQHGLSEPQIRQLGALDGFWLQYVQLNEKNQHLRVTLHQQILLHYQNQLSTLS